MKRVYALILSFVASTAFAQTAADTSQDVLFDKLEEASRIDDPSVRLQTYDALVHEYELSSQPMV